MIHLLIVGLGNPGKKYEHNRHNIGFIILDEYAKSKGESWKENKKYNESLITGDSYRLHLLKPLEFMNLSGKAVQTFAQLYKIPAANILVLQDEVDLPFGKIKNKIGGGTAGHNGLKDIVEKIGSSDFHRLRFGVGKPEKGQMEVADYVLQNFTEEERKEFDALLLESTKKIDEWLKAALNNLKKGSAA
ncbi:aminoacyl-tRNA hydrolase [Leptospira ilyithenensis]|uniref:Peptidyl-tRNA hydrolase n=1 Tax=Leptospira ilyithenensis TaxID=2484901 RepID=A0A4R9LVD1_9LEPT|nr:aminoacyl-tRNA hydrolase [Leptospira ilyithenensis]TGN11859.1 aminoacyl-tRNA hydrolase [Leptospira ilyithenensis]